MKTLDIEGNADKQTVASILAMNGYTVRIVSVRENNRSKKVLQYEEPEDNKKRGGAKQ